MTLLPDAVCVGVWCTSSIIAILCIFGSKIQKRYGLSNYAMTALTMSCVIIGCALCAVMREVA